MHRGPLFLIRGVTATICLLAIVFPCVAKSAAVKPEQVEVRSPDRRNAIALEIDDEDGVEFSVSRDGQELIGPSPLGPMLVEEGWLGANARIVDQETGKVNESFEFTFGKTSHIFNRYEFCIVTLVNDKDLTWQVELRSYDEGVAVRYVLPKQDKLQAAKIRAEATEFSVVGDPVVIFNVLEGFTTSHESLYERKPISKMPPEKLCDMPVLLTWPKKQAAAITEARVRGFAGMYLERAAEKPETLRCRLSPLPEDSGVCVAGETPLTSPWRVVMLADEAGELLESNLLVCLNDPPQGDFTWAKPGKTTFSWWNGEFEDDYKLKGDKNQFVARNFAYIDFCARHNIAYHGVHGDGLSWYQQSSTDYGAPAADADVRVPRPEIELPKILAYASERGVGIRLWVHWRPLSEHLEEAFTLYESWGVEGLMVDFLDRDDQEMIDWSEQMLESAARHHLHIQIHGSSKLSGEQRTFPNLFNREGVLNLEYDKWSKSCTPDHNVNVAYTRGLAGPVDFHLGGFRSVSRVDFEPQGLKPNVMGTRCHNLALYVVFENPMPMVADVPSAYEGQPGFDFLTEVPTTWDETRFLTGIPGEYIVVGRRKGDTWYIGGITNWTPRKLSVPLEFLDDSLAEITLYVDGSSDEAKPNQVRKETQPVDAKTPLSISMSPGGGFVAIVEPKPHIDSRVSGGNR
jgi:alpha-glucosidase